MGLISRHQLICCTMAVVSIAALKSHVWVLERTGSIQTTRREQSTMMIEQQQKGPRAPNSNNFHNSFNNSWSSRPNAFRRRRANAANNDNSKRAFVCITGQVQRLELQNKVRTVLSPLKQAGYHPVVALILSDDGNVHFTNDHQSKYVSEFDNYTQAVSYLSQEGYEVATTTAFEQPKEPILNMNYYRVLSKFEDGDDRKMTQAKNHIRIFESFTKCWKEMSKSSTSYDLVIRVRDDVGLRSPLRLQRLLGLLRRHPRSVVASDCRRHSGMNDRMALLLPDVAWEVFMEPFIRYYSKPVPTPVFNTETYLHHTYANAGLRVIRTWLLRGVVKLAINADDGQQVEKPLEDKEWCPGRNATVLYNGVKDIWYLPKRGPKARPNTTTTTTTILTTQNPTTTNTTLSPPQRQQQQTRRRTQQVMQ